MQTATMPTSFRPGDHIVYPAHGVGRVMGVEKQAVAGIEFRHSADPATADIVIGALAEPRGIAYANVAFRSPADGADVASLQQALVCFNPAQRWSVGFDGDPATFDIRYSAMHEIGHAIGLPHADDPASIMCCRRGAVDLGDPVVRARYVEARRRPEVRSALRQLQELYPRFWQP